MDCCRRLAALQERRTKLALGAALLEQGLITKEQFQQLGASIARDLGIPAASPGSLALPTKPVYEPPPLGLAQPLEQQCLQQPPQALSKAASADQLVEKN